MTIPEDDKETEEVSINPTKVLGISPEVRGNGTFLDENNILYVCDKSVIKYNLKEKIGKVEINTLLNKQDIESFAVSPQRSLIALGISGRNALITIYKRNDTMKNDRFIKKTNLNFTNKSSGTLRVLNIDFSSENNFLAAIIAPPYRLCVFSLEREVIVLNLRFTHFHGRLTTTMNQVCFNPRNDKVFALVGEGVFRTISLRIVKKNEEWEIRFKTMGFYQAKHLFVTSVCWFDADTIFAGTLDGRFFVVENSELKGIYAICSLSTFYIPIKPPNIKVRECIHWARVAERDVLNSERFRISQISVFDGGFVLASERIHIYEEPPNRPRWFVQTGVFDIDLALRAKIVVNMYSYPTSKLITYCTKARNVYFIDLRKTEDPLRANFLENISASEERAEFISTCLWKPVCLSISGNDLCYWNYNTAEVINKWTFPSKARTVSLSPDGSRFCLALENNLCVFEIGHNHKFLHQFRNCELNLQVFYEGSFGHCTFSDGGSFFCGSTKRKLYLFSSVSYQIVNVFEPPSMLIRSFIDDIHGTITSIGQGGLAVRYDLKTGKLIWEYTDRNSEFTEFTKDKERKTIYITGSNGSLTKINYSSKISKPTVHPMNLGKLRAIAISDASRVIYLGSEEGSLVEVHLSEMEELSSNEASEVAHMRYFVQSMGISQIIVTPSNKLITGNNGGCLCVYDIVGPKYTEYECPHKTTDFFLGRFNLLKFITSVRKLNEKTLNDWYDIKEFMVGEKFTKMAESKHAVYTDAMEVVESQLKEIEKTRDYYSRVWEEMDYFWGPQEMRQKEIYNNYLYYNEQYRCKSNAHHDAWTRGLWHLKHIDNASIALCNVLDSTLNKIFDKATIQERLKNVYQTVGDTQMKQMQEIRKKIAKAYQVQRKIYIFARNTWNGLQQLIMQEASRGKVSSFSNDLLRKQYNTYIVPFQDDIKLLDKVYQKLLHEVFVRKKEIQELSYYDDGPTGISMAFVPNLMSSPYALEKLKQDRARDMSNYLNSLPSQWRELRRWDWLVEECNDDYHKWFMLGQGNFADAFYNSHAYHDLLDEEKLKHLDKKQLSLIHSCSADYVTISRKLKFVEQFYFQCIKVQNEVQRKLCQIDDLETIPLGNLFEKLMDVYMTIKKPNKIREDVYYLKKRNRAVASRRGVVPKQVCPESPYLTRNKLLRQEKKIYELTTTPKGYVLLINNVDFDSDDLDRREGSINDFNQLRVLFRDLGFRVKHFSNLDSNSFMRVVRDFARMEELWKVDSAILIVMTHGHKDKNDLRTVDLAMTDEKYISSDWLRERFTNDRCKALRNKPKIIVLQACRDESDKDVIVRRSKPSERDPPPLITDMLIINSCLPGYGAHRNSKSGSWFTQELIRSIRTHGTITDLYSILNKVDRKLRERYVREKATSYQAVYYENWSFNRMFFLSRRAAGAHKAAVALVALSPACRGDKKPKKTKKGPQPAGALTQS